MPLRDSRKEAVNQAETPSIVSGFSQMKETVSSTASALITPFTNSGTPKLKDTLRDITPHLQAPSFQKRMLSAASPSELIRSNLPSSDISYRQITYLPDELLRDIPEENTALFSLLQGFEASLPESPKKLIKSRASSRNRSSENGEERKARPTESKRIERERDQVLHNMEIIAVRKALASSEIREIDTKLRALTAMREKLLIKLAALEAQETDTSDELQEIETKLLNTRELEEIVEIEQEVGLINALNDDDLMTGSAFLSESTYGSLQRNTMKSRKRKAMRRRSAPVLHQHYEPGASIKTITAHSDTISALDFDAPFGTLVTASVDDTVRVWNLATGRCQGLLEGHIASVRTLQLEDHIVATGSADAKIKLWDLSLSDLYAGFAPSSLSNLINKSSNQIGSDGSTSPANSDAAFLTQSPTDCCVHTFDAHIGDVTALYFLNNTLVSGSEDKTIRQWDMTTGRLLQTMDIVWTVSSHAVDESIWRQSSTVRRGGEASFVGALQCFDQGFAAGTADGHVRFWDLRTGQVARTLVGHTGPVTSLQFDEIHLVSGSMDRSVRVWDLRTGSIHDSYAYDKGITSLQFDARRIVTAAGESAARVYDRIESRHWVCGDESGSGIVREIRCREGYLVGGQTDGVVGIWSV